MDTIPSQITSLTIVYSTVIQTQIKKICMLRVTGLCARNSLVTGEFPAQMASNAENVSIWWRHHDTTTKCFNLIPGVAWWGVPCHIDRVANIQYKYLIDDVSQFVQIGTLQKQTSCEPSPAHIIQALRLRSRECNIASVLLSLSRICLLSHLRHCCDIHVYFTSQQKQLRLRN